MKLAATGEHWPHQRSLLEDNWIKVRDGLEVKLCASPDSEETFILCRSNQRHEKEKAMRERFEKRIEEGLAKIEETCRKKRHQARLIAERVGRLRERNSRASGLFAVDVQADETGAARVVWSKVEAWREWARLSEGCYLLRSNVKDWSAEDL